ncbi:MAG: hypothetical protein HYV39_00580, partial [Candidatus Levybacteria bacterium]|nr:hypothetical protein [Candidatus Levybacteria bacterium]
AAFLKPWEWLAEKPEEQLQKVQQEVIRLARLQPPDSLINTVYRGDISTFNPIFKSKTRSGFTNEEYAQIGFINASYSPDQRFRFTSLINQSTATYATLDKLDVAIYFSPFWLNSTDQVKLLAMEKEAINLALWNSFCQIALNTYRNQGRIDLIDPRVTERELANTMGRQLIIENPLMQKLYDYAGYLAVMPKVGQLLQLQDPQINKDLFEHSNFGTIYQMAQRSKIEVNLEFGSREFLTTAFNENGPWGKMIADPSVGAPPIPVPPRR